MGGWVGGLVFSFVLVGGWICGWFRDIFRKGMRDIYIVGILGLFGGGIYCER
jgi:hypothetical protein